MFVKVVLLHLLSKLFRPGNFENRFIGDNIKNISDKFGKNHVASKSITVTIPDIIWLSVRLDMNPPNEMYDIVSNRNPKSAHNVSVTFVIPPANMQRII